MLFKILMLLQLVDFLFATKVFTRFKYLQIMQKLFSNMLASPLLFLNQ